MAGPTPVSALIHAATMVTAGVYMIVRCSAIYMHAPTAMFIVAIIGAATAMFAATIGLAQNDIKKVLAYSTISQLGYMFLACGVGAFAAAIFHVITHAFFKALLFLGSGSVIHGMHHEQDMRRMGGLKKYMPITFATMLTGWLAISGIPIFAGFFSKDEILWKTWSAGTFALPSPVWSKAALGRRRAYRAADRRLHDAHDGDDVLGHRALSRKPSGPRCQRTCTDDASHNGDSQRGSRRCPSFRSWRARTARIALDDDRAADCAGRSFNCRRVHRSALCARLLFSGHPANYIEQTLEPVIAAVPGSATAHEAGAEPAWLSPPPQHVDGAPAFAPLGEDHEHGERIHSPKRFARSDCWRWSRS